MWSAEHYGSQEGIGGTVQNVGCFVTGTGIATPSGEVAVERLSPGDVVCVAGPEGVLPVRWVGHRRLSLDALAEAELFAPVRVCAGAVAPGLPVRDLLPSPDHAVLLDGVLVPVRQLINGRTIRAEPARGAVTYWVGQGRRGPRTVFLAQRRDHGAGGARPTAPAFRSPRRVPRPTRGPP